MKSIRFTLVVFFLIAYNSLLLSETLPEKENNKFMLSLKLENDFVTITNIKSCRFTSIGFRLTTNGKPIGFNEFGMFDLNKRQKPREENNFAQFSFSVHRNENGLVIKGIEGVDWEQLELTYNTGDNACLYQISHSGIEKQ